MTVAAQVDFHCGRCKKQKGECKEPPLVIAFSLEGFNDRNVWLLERTEMIRKLLELIDTHHDTGIAKLNEIAPLPQPRPQFGDLGLTLVQSKIGGDLLPFKSKAQARKLFATNPKVAKEFAAATPNMKKLPERAGKKKSKKGRSR